jgi:ClpP class serine protease
VAGVTEAASAIAQIAKPVYAVADYQATSAAYWLAAQADRLFVPPTGMVGSIGVYAVRIDATKADQQAGLAYDFIASGARKGDGDPHKPVTKAELQDLQRMVDDSFAMFAGAVATARGLDVPRFARSRRQAPGRGRRAGPRRPARHRRRRGRRDAGVARATSVAAA